MPLPPPPPGGFRQPPPWLSKRSRTLHPQAAVSQFWYRYHSRTPGKITSILTRELYKNVARSDGEPQANRRNAGQSYEKARAECIAKVRAAVEQCERTNTRFYDCEFDIETDFNSSDLYCLNGLLSDESDDSGNEEEEGFWDPRHGLPGRSQQVKESLRTLRDSGLLADQQVTVNMNNLERYVSPQEQQHQKHQQSQKPEKCRPFGSSYRTLPKSIHRLDWIFENPKFTVDGYSCSDIKQGGVGDCWWLAGVGNIAHRRDLMEKICVARDEECGVYGFVFYRDGEWISTVIDDNLYMTHEDFAMSTDVYDVSGKKARLHKKQKQTGSESLFFAKCEDENETWLPLLEKAYAKVHGDYAAIEGGWAGTAVEDLTGGVTTMMLGNCVLRKQKLWQEMIGVDEVNSEFVFALSATSDSGAQRKNGIVMRHAYSILKATEIEDDSGRKLRLLKIRNPWGQRSDAGYGVWHGPWSDGSKEWTPEILKKLGHEFRDDGVFWMAFEDVLSNFKWIHRTRLFDERWTVAQQWMSTSVSWVPGFLKSKFVVEIKKEGMVVIVLSTLDQRYFTGLEGMYDFSLEFQLKSVGSDSVNFFNSNRISASLDIRSVNCEVNLKPGVYEVIPKVTATHANWRKPVEQVVMDQVKSNPAKLRQVGMQYDLAHAKAGVLDEDETQRKIRQEKRRKEKERSKSVGPNPNPNGYLEGVVQRLVTTVQEEVRRSLVVTDKSNNNSNGNKGEDKERGKSTQKAPESNTERGEASFEEPQEVNKLPPGRWPDDVINDIKDTSARVSEEGPRIQRTVSKRGKDAKAIVESEKPTKEVVREPEPMPAPLPQPPLPAPVVHNNDPPPAEADDSSSSSGSDSDSDSDSDTDSDSWSDSESEEDGTERRWNPVCVMCLRVYAQDKEVSVKLVESDAGDAAKPVEVEGSDKVTEKQPAVVEAKAGP